MKRVLALVLLTVTLFTVGHTAAFAQAAPPLSALDGELLTKVKLAGLWEIPSGMMAQQMSSDPRVQEVGRTLVADHTMLDDVTNKLAAQYGHPLPSAPNDSQKSWLTEMATANGAAQFESVWAMRLRSAHGMIFPLIAQVRAETTDPEIRKYATTANTVVLKHMTILESTNNVDFAALAAPTPLGLSSDSDGTDMMVAVMLLPLLVVVAVFLLWLATKRNRRRAPVSRLDEEDERGNERDRHRRDDGKRSRLFADGERTR